MREKIKMRDIQKSVFKETPESFRNAINNAIAEVVHTDYENCQSFEKDKSAILPNTQILTAVWILIPTSSISPYRQTSQPSRWKTYSLSTIQ